MRTFQGKRIPAPNKKKMVYVRFHLCANHDAHRALN
jgi:hypothetical protein